MKKRTQTDTNQTIELPLIRIKNKNLNRHSKGDPNSAAEINLKFKVI